MCQQAALLPPPPFFCAEHSPCAIALFLLLFSESFPISLHVCCSNVVPRTKSNALCEASLLYDLDTAKCWTSC